MADRTLSVKLLADIQGYVQGMDKVAAKTRETTATVEQKLAEQKRAYEQVGAAAMTIGALAAAGVTAAVVAFANFDQAMSNVQAATHESAENMGLLRDAALEAGARTVFSATEAAGAIEELAKAGITTADILGGGLDGALDLAAAGGIAVADAAEIAASAMTQFGLKGTEVTHIADLLAAGAGKAQGGVSELGDALNQSGLVASQMGLSIDETVGSLAAFASAGLIGSDAGTSFRAMLLRLANPTKESQQLMDDLGLSFYDAQGAFIGVEGMAGQLQERLADLTQEQRNQALAQIFGQDAIRTSAILYEQGAEGVREWTAAVDDSGYAAETAATRLDNLKGDFEQLAGALETALIGIGESGDGPLRTVVTGLADLVTGFTELPGPVQQSVGVLGGVVAVVGLVGGGAMVAIPQIVAFRASLATLGVTAASTRAALATTATFLGGPWGLAIGAAVVSIAGFNAALEASKTTTEEWQNLLTTGMGAGSAQGILDATNEVIFQVDELGAALDSMKGRDLFTEALGGNEQASFLMGLTQNLEEFGTELSTLASSDFPAASDAFRAFVEEGNLSEEQILQLVDTMGPWRDALVAQATEMGINVQTGNDLRDTHRLVGIAMGEVQEAADGAESGIADVGDAAETSAEQTHALIEAQDALTEKFFGVMDASAAFEQVIDDIDQAFADAAANNESLAAAWDTSTGMFEDGTQAGRDANQMLQDMVIAANDETIAMSEANATTDEMRAAQERARAELERVAGRLDSTGQAAQTFAGHLRDIPDVDVEVTASTSAAQWVVDDFWRRNNGRVIRMSVEAGQAGVGGGAVGSDIIRRAGGGIIPGPPSSTDNIIAALATGEYVVNAAMTSRYRHVLDAINSGRFPAYATGGYVGGYAAQSPVVHVAAPAMGPLAVPQEFIRELGDYVAAQLQGTGRTAFSNAASYTNAAIQGEAVVRR